MTIVALLRKVPIASLSDVASYYCDNDSLQTKLMKVTYSLQGLVFVQLRLCWQCKASPENVITMVVHLLFDLINYPWLKRIDPLTLPLSAVH